MNRNLTDDIWDEVLLQIVQHGELEMDDLSFNLTERHKARRVLNSMESMGWVRREKKTCKTWKLGERGKEVLTVSDDVIE